MGRSDGRGAPTQALGVYCMPVSWVPGAWLWRAAAAGWPWRRASSSAACARGRATGAARAGDLVRAPTGGVVCGAPRPLGCQVGRVTRIFCDL